MFKLKFAIIAFCALVLTGPTYAFLGIFGQSENTAGLINYAKPVLEFVSASTVAVSRNGKANHNTTIIFPDGNVRNVSEASGSENRFRRLDLSRNAVFTSCGQNAERTGLNPGLTRTDSTWYSVYAVKSQCAGGSDNFTLVGATVNFTPSNRNNLDNAFGSSGYVYLGLIANGNGVDGVGNADQIKEFVQTGDTTIFFGLTATGNNSMVGIHLSSFTAEVATYTYTAGNDISSSEIPSNITMSQYQTAFGTFTGNIIVQNENANEELLRAVGNAANAFKYPVPFYASERGLRAVSNGAATLKEITLWGFIDGGLSQNSSP